MDKTRNLAAMAAVIALGWAISGCAPPCDEADHLCDDCGGHDENACRNEVNACMDRYGDAPSQGDCCDIVFDKYRGRC